MMSEENATVACHSGLSLDVWLPLEAGKEWSMLHGLSNSLCLGPI